nr:hypothetical protein [Chryseobacterium indologenes]
MPIINNSTVDNNAIQYLNLFAYTTNKNKITNAASIGLLAEEVMTVKMPNSIPKVGFSGFCGI